MKVDCLSLKMDVKKCIHARIGHAVKNFLVATMPGIILLFIIAK